MNLTISIRDFPIRSMDQTNTLSIAPDRIASIASSPERRSRQILARILVLTSKLTAQS